MDAKDRAGFVNQMARTQAARLKPVTCRECGAEVRGKFCPKCGTPAVREQSDADWTPAEPQVQGEHLSPEQDQNISLELEDGSREKAVPEGAPRQPAGRRGERGQGTETEPADGRGVRRPGAVTETAGSFSRRRQEARRGPVPPTASTQEKKAEKSQETVGLPKERTSGQRRKVEPYVVPARRPAPSGERGTGIFRAVQAEDSTEQSVFAEGLPQWSLEPPQAPVRRKGTRL